MGRRGFITALLSLGVSGEAAAQLSSKELKKLTDDPKRNVPRIKYLKHKNHEAVMKGEEPPNKAPEYYTISRDRWVRIEAAKDVVNCIGRKLTTSSEVGKDKTKDPTNVQIGITNRVADGLGVVVQKVEYPDRSQDEITPQSNKVQKAEPDLEKLREVVPTSATGTVSYDGKTEKIDSVQVITEKQTREEQDYFDKKYRPVPVGCQIGSPEGAGTNGAPAYDYENNEQVWVTAHMIDRSSGLEITQSANGGTIGYSTRSTESGHGDAGLIDGGVDATSVHWAIASEVESGEDYDWDVQGIIHNDRIEDMVEAGEKARFQGMKTGRSHSKVLDFTTPDWNGNAGTVEIDHDSSGGDSGGSYYELDSDGAYIMGIHAWGSGETAKGNTMEYIENQLNIGV